MQANKLLIAISISLTFSQVSANEDDCETPTLTGFMEKVTNYPKCVGEDPESRNDFRKAVKSLHGNKEAFNELCSSSKCKLIIIESPGEKSIENDPILAKNQKDFTLASLDALKKNLSQTINDLITLRSSFPTDINTDGAIKACNIQDNLSNFKCANGKTIESILTNVLGSNPFPALQSNIASEMASIITGKNYENSILNRTEPKCSITNNQLLHIKRLYLESLVTPELIEALSSVSITEYVNKQNKDRDPKAPKLKAGEVDFFAAANESIDGNLVETLNKLRFHPLLKGILSSNIHRDEFLSDLKKLSKKKGGTNENAKEALVELLYSEDKKKHNPVNDAFESRCQESFKSLQVMFCSDKFAKGNVLFESDSSFKTANGYELSSIRVPQQDINEVNKKAVEFCYLNSNLTNKPLNFADINNQVCGEIPSLFKSMDYPQFKSKAYAAAFGDPQDNICKYESAGACKSSDKDCELFSFWQNLKKTGTVEADLAKNSNQNINLILGSFIGSNTKIPDGKSLYDQFNPEVVKDLRTEGILPNPDGTHTPSTSTVSTPKAYNERVRTQSSGGGSNVVNNGGPNKQPAIKPQEQSKGVTNNTNFSSLGSDTEESTSGTGNFRNDQNSGTNNVVNNTGSTGNNDQFKENLLKKAMNGAGKRKKLRGGNLRELDGPGNDTTSSFGGGIQNPDQVTQNGPTGQEFVDDFAPTDYQAGLKENNSNGAGSTAGGYVDRDNTLLKTKYAGDATGGSTGSGEPNRAPADEKSGQQTVVELPAITIDPTLPPAEQESALITALGAQSQLFEKVQKTQPEQFSIKINSHTIKVIKGANGLYSAVPNKDIPKLYIGALNKKLSELTKRNYQYQNFNGNFQNLGN